ncbi:MAG: extensin family protein [Deltaproteobacteria bacterium]|nr:extensin family protein [Deltaproteobacteria bacterium]
MSRARIWLGLALACIWLLASASPAEARRRKRRPNMPQGHTWPPSKPMKNVGLQCQARLTALGIKWEEPARPKKRKRKRRRRRGKRRKANRSKSWTRGQIATPVVVPDMMFGKVKLTPIWRKGPQVLDCHLAEAIALTSPRWYALGVRELRFSSIYQYREVRYRGSTSKALSRHALGLAIDVYEFVDEQGRAHVVEDHYWGLGLFLPAIEVVANSGGEFRTVITPLRDPASHHDHFHFEAQVEYPVVKSRRRARSAKHRARKRRRARRKKRRRSRMRR